MTPQFGAFTATELYCPKCRAAQPVGRLLLILPSGELHEFLCARCATSLGERTVTGSPRTAPRFQSPRPAKRAAAEIANLNRLRIVFFGTAELACASLAALAAQPDFEIVGVVTQPDRPRGRDLKLQPTPVKELALRHSLRVLQPERARHESFIGHAGRIASRPDRGGGLRADSPRRPSSTCHATVV